MRCWVDGALVAVWLRSPTLVHLGRLNIGAMGPTTYSLGTLCDVGRCQVTSRPVGFWHEALPNYGSRPRRRCPKCVRRYDELYLRWVEGGCQQHPAYREPHYPGLYATWVGP